MNKTAKIVSALHGTAFTLFFIIDIILQYFLYPLLDEQFHSPFLSVLIATLVSAVLYSALYFIVYYVYKLFMFRIFKKKPYIHGVWYHVHIKRDLHGFVATDKLRAGETRVKQTLYDVSFEANNSYFYLKDGQVVEDTNATRSTHWKHVACDWEDEDSLIACYEADSRQKDSVSECPYCHTKFSSAVDIQGEKKNRVGIHRLNITNASQDRGKMEGTFADEYPSASYGEIFFFRRKEDRDALIADFLADGTIDGNF